MKLSHSQRATAKHLGMTEDEYLEHDRLIDLGRDTLLNARKALVECIAELDRVGGALGNARPGRFNGELDTVLEAVNHALRCGDCGVPAGQLHSGGCDVERCKACGWQAFSCGCPQDTPFTTWTGLWPGTLEEREYGLLDLNMLAVFQAHGYLVWNSDDERLYKSTDITEEQWQHAVIDYIAKEEKMSNQIMANW